MFYVDSTWVEERGTAEPVGERRARESVHAHASAAAAGKPKLIMHIPSKLVPANCGNSCSNKICAWSSKLY
jgi:hypothetical protein